MLAFLEQVIAAMRQEEELVAAVVAVAVAAAAVIVVQVGVVVAVVGRSGKRVSWKLRGFSTRLLAISLFALNSVRCKP